MDASGKVSKSREISMREDKKNNDVVVTISGGRDVGNGDSHIVSSSPTHNEISKIPTTETSTPQKSNTPPEEEDEYEDEVIYRIMIARKKYRMKKTNVLIECIAFVCIMGCLVASLLLDKWKDSTIWGLEIWKWCVLLMVTFCGMLVTNLFISIIIFLAEHSPLLRTKVLYFVHALRINVVVCIWLSLVLVTWVWLFNYHEVKRSATAIRVLDYITWTLVSLLIGSYLWLLKSLLVKKLVISFHLNALFYRIHKSIFSQFVLETLSRLPVIEERKMNGKEERKKKEAVDINKIHQMQLDEVSSWTKMMLVDLISNTPLSTFLNDHENEQTSKEITSETDAIDAAKYIFKKVAQHNRNYIDEEDLKKFLKEDEAEIVLILAGMTGTKRIEEKSLTDWVVKVYNDRKTLAKNSNEKKTPVEELNKLLIGILIVVMIFIWLFLMEIANTKVLLFLSSQLVVTAFIFGNTCKTIFEAIIFVFMMHPFSVGERCVIDGVQMTVEEIHILTTIFLKFDDEMIYYPNSLLATKPISNFNRSPNMGDSLEFSIDFLTPVQDIVTLKEKIRQYIEENSSFWRYNHNVVVKDIENVDKLKIALFFHHTMNFQDSEEKNMRRSEMVIKMKEILEELEINYSFLAQRIKHVKPGKITSGTNG